MQAQIVKGSEKAFIKGEAHLAKKDYTAAQKAYRKSIELDSTNAEAYLRLAGLAKRDGKLDESKANLIKAIHLDREKFEAYLLNVGEICWDQAKYKESAKYLEEFLKSDVRNPKLRKKAEKYLRDAQFIIEEPITHDIEVATLPATINTDAAEYLPSLPASENLMVFTRRVRGQEDFYVSKYHNGEWLKAIPIDDLNSPENEGAHCLSADGKLLIFTACARRDGLGSCDLYFSVLKDGNWTTPRNLGPQVNSKSWDAQPSLSASGTTLYFSSDRPGGFGGRDLWSVNRTNKGWGEPSNLGEINTIDNEESPYIHFDNESLYFMSNGHPGFGGYDLFLTQNKGDWQKPTNLGRPINTKEDEGALHVDRLGMIGYFARSAPPRSGLQVDIMSFPLPPKLKPNPATYVNISVVDMQTNEPLQGVVEVYDLTTQTTFLKTLTDQDGLLLVCLNSGTDYAFNVDKVEYVFYSANITLSGDSPKFAPTNIVAPLQPLKKPETATAPEPIVLKNIFFATGKAELLESSTNELEKLYLLLKKNADLNITIQGHTDNVGTPEDNLKLSNSRAQAVRDYLVTKGISSTRLNFEGFGEAKPIATNETDEGKQKNRRTEFIIE